MIKKLLAPRKTVNTQTENENWQKFKSEADEKITLSENKVDEFKKQSNRINRNDKSKYNGKVIQLEQKNSKLRKKMEAYVDDRSDRQDKFTEDFSKDMKEIT